MFTNSQPAASAPDGLRVRRQSTPTVVASFRPKSLLAASLGPSGSAHTRGQDWTIGLPTHWDQDDCSPLLEVSSDGLGVAFRGSGRNGDRDAAAVRANRPMPSQAGVYYYEISVISKGQHGYVGIGFCALNVQLSRLPGWEPQASYGYHADDGHSFASSGTGRAYGPKWTSGDVVGCGLDFACRRAFFCKNGVFLGHVFDDLPLSTPFYPSIGLRTPGEVVRANFGQSPFRFDIEHFVTERSAAVDRAMRSAALQDRYLVPPRPAPPAPDQPRWPADAADLDVQSQLGVKRTAAELVRSYLEYHGFVDTAAAFERQRRGEDAAWLARLGFGRHTLDRPSASGDALAQTAAAPQATARAEQRRDLTAAIMRGDAQGALSTLRQSLPDVLPFVERDLRLLTFVELVVQLAARSGVLDASAEDAEDDLRRDMLACGRALDTDYGGSDATLRNVFGLIVAADPASARPDLAGQPARRRVAELVNSAMLGANCRAAFCADEPSSWRPLSSSSSRGGLPASFCLCDCPRQHWRWSGCTFAHCMRICRLRARISKWRHLLIPLLECSSAVGSAPTRLSH